MNVATEGSVRAYLVLKKLVRCGIQEAEDHMCGLVEAVEANGAVQASDGGKGGERRCGSGCEERPLEAGLGVVSDGSEAGEAITEHAQHTNCPTRISGIRLMLARSTGQASPKIHRDPRECHLG